MLEKNKADSRKYFIFKIRDLVHNSFHTLEEKRTESLELWNEYFILLILPNRWLLKTVFLTFGHRYVNSVLSTILYYQEKNNLYSITDILISVDATYQDYNKKLSPDIKKKKKKSSSEIASETLSPEDIYRIVRPKYLFIE